MKKEKKKKKTSNKFPEETKRIFKQKVNEKKKKEHGKVSGTWKQNTRGGKYE